MNRRQLLTSVLSVFMPSICFARGKEKSRPAYLNFLEKIRGGDRVSSVIFSNPKAETYNEMRKLHAQIRHLSSDLQVEKILNQRISEDLLKGRIRFVDQFVVAETECLLMLLSRSYAF